MGASTSADDRHHRTISLLLFEQVAKFWLDPVELSKAGRVADHELRRIEKLVIEHRGEFIEAWNDFFGD